MRLLALESSSDRCSVALWHDGAVHVREGDGVGSHSRLMLPFVDAVLAEAGVALRQLDAIAFGAGPGGFTGLRLACGVGQGLAFGAGLPLIGVCSLEALALASGAESVYVAVDARMNEVYCAAYRVRDGRVEAVVAPCVAALAAMPLPPAAAWHGCGSGFAAHPQALREQLTERIATIDAAAIAHAREVAILAAPRLAAGERPDAALAAPLYVREKVALTTAERGARAPA